MKYIILLLFLVSCQNPLMDGNGISQFSPFVSTSTISCSNSSLFDFDSTKIEVKDGKCSLKKISQTQTQVTTGTGIIWDHNELILGNNNGCDGSITNCSSLDASWTPKFSALLGYWKLDESTGDILDSTSHGNNLTLTEIGANTRGVNSKVRQGLQMGYRSYGFNIYTTANLQLHQTSSFTYSIWVKPVSSRNPTPESNNGISGTNGQSYAVFPYCTLGWDGTNQKVCTGISVGTNGIAVYEHADGHMPSPLTYNVTINDWVHVVVVYNNRTPKLYLNGVYIKDGVTSSRSIVIPSATLGDQSNTWSGSGYGPFVGGLDEFAIWGVALSDAEIAHLYARQSPQFSGSYVSQVIDAQTPAEWNRILLNGSGVKYQVKACDQSDCSDGNWVGSDGTSNTYYSSTDQALTYSNKQYFQYQFVLDDSQSSLEQLQILPDHFNLGPATISPRERLDAKKIQSISVASSCTNVVKWSLSSDGISWSYWNAGAWSSSANASQASTLDQLNSALSTYSESSFYLRAHLQGDGLTDCNIQNISFTTKN